MSNWTTSIRKYSTILVVLALLAPVTLIAYYNLPGFFQTAIEYTGYGGSGADGALVVDGSTNGPSNPLYTDDVRTYVSSAAASGQADVTVNDASSFNIGDEVLVIQIKSSSTRNNYETKTITNKVGNVLTLDSNLTYSYSAYGAANSAQVIRIPHYSSVTINSGGFLTVHDWDGFTGGVMFFRSNGPVTINYNATLSGTISVKGKGHGGIIGSAGTGPGGLGTGGTYPGGGGSNKSPGSYRSAFMGSSGGDGAINSNGAGNGGGILIFKTSGTLTLDGNIWLDGANATGASDAGGGSGGTAIISAHTITKTSSCGPITHNGGSGDGTGTNGGSGRVFVLYNNTIGCTNNVTPTTNRTFMKFQVR